jgi:hypothetical protein
MPFVPMELMMARVRKFGADSDAALFHELLYAGEFIVKMTTAAVVAAIQDDRAHHRYGLIHGLVRASSIGEWASKLDEALTGPASQHLTDVAKEDRRVFNDRVGKDGWQYEAVRELRDVLRAVHPWAQLDSDRVTLRAWFLAFAELRNKTRGHGAITPAACAKLAPMLDRSIRLLCKQNPVFIRPWAYLHRNLSGKYNVVDLGDDVTAFANLKKADAIAGDNYPNGLYISVGEPRRVELVRTDLNALDFYLPNGAFNGKTFELHSLITDSRLEGDTTPYLAVAGERPPSDTHGRSELDTVGNVLTNLPAVPTGYVRRPRLENDVKTAVLNDRHPIVTLVGRGGIGKTSLALSVLHEIAATNRYDVILWFSARDIDLSITGPKVVQPQVLTERDIAGEFKALIEPFVGVSGDGADGKSSTVTVMAEHLRESTLGSVLFVFDNFETVRSPVDLFQWIDTHIRLPNKAMITSRFRDFKADYPIEVSGMERAEVESLINQTAASLGIAGLITPKYRDQIFEESDGHPYVIKIILGEVSDAKTLSKPKNLIARKDDILDALFERTFANLSPIASRIFLTLSGWRSMVPQLALEAVLLRHPMEVSDPEAGVNELVRMSLVERTPAPDGMDFLDVPLTASLFGSKKLAVSPTRIVIENDIRFLQDIGPTAMVALKEGIRPRIQSLFRLVTKRIGEESATLDDMRPVLEFVARGYAPAWLMLADLQQEVQGEAGRGRVAEYVQRFLEQQPPTHEAQAAWQRLYVLYRAANDVIGACTAFVNAAQISAPPLQVVSNVANWLNTERDVIDTMDVVERGTVFRPMAHLLERHLAEASATDLSRLAWLHLHAGNDQRARDVADLGLQRDRDNVYCQRLIERLAGNV